MGLRVWITPIPLNHFMKANYTNTHYCNTWQNVDPFIITKILTRHYFIYYMTLLEVYILLHSTYFLNNRIHIGSIKRYSNLSNNFKSYS